MSTQVDQRVVEMRFDNAQFERNISQSTESLENLKKALQLDDAGKSFDNIEKAAKGLNLSSITEQVQSVKTSFSALESFASGVFQKLGFNLADYIQKFSSTLNQFSLFGQFNEGFGKYSQINQSIQTITAAGYSMEDVSKTMEKLTWFADETSYGLSDMTDNMAKFTAQNVPLEQSATAMEGIAVWAARSGQESQAAARAMYNFAQALGVGAVTTIDWKSIENANMATAEFKKTAIDAALKLGKLKTATDGTVYALDQYGKQVEVTVESFRNTLSTKWFDEGVIMETLNEYGKATDLIHKLQVQSGLETYEILNHMNEVIEKGKLQSEVILKNGMSIDSYKNALQTLASEEYKMSRESFEMAQNAITLGQAINYVKDAASTGWAKIFQSIFGNFEQSRNVWSNMAEDLGRLFVEPVTRLGERVRKTFSSNYEQIEQSITASGGNVEAFRRQLIEFMKTDDELAKNIDENGKLINTTFEELFQSGQLGKSNIIDALRNLAGEAGEAGEAAVNAEEKVAALAEKVRDVIRGNYGNGQARRTALGEDYERIQDLVNKVINGGVVSIEDLTEAELRNLGLTEDEAKAFAALWESMEDGNSEINTLAENVDKISGRQLFAESIHNAFQGLINIIDKFREAWDEAMDTEGQNGFYNILEAIHKGTEAFAKWTDETNIVTNAVRLLAKAFKFIGSVVETAVWIAIETWNTLGEVIGKIINKVYEWREQADNSTSSVKKMYNALKPFAKSAKSATEAIKIFITNLKNSEIAQSIFSGIVSVATSAIKIAISIFTWFESHLPGIVGWFQNLIGKARAFFEAIKENEKVQKAWEKISQAVENLWETVKTKFGEITETVGNFFDGFSTDSATAESKFESFKNKISEIVDKIMSLFDPNKDTEIDVANLLPKINFNGWHSFSEMFAGLTTDTEEDAGKVETALASVSGAVTNFRLAAQGNSLPIENSFNDLTNSFANFAEKLSGIELDKAIGVLAGSAMMGIMARFSKSVQTVSDAVTNFGKAALNFSKPAASIANFVDTLNTTFKKKQKLQTFKDIAKGLLIVSAAIAVLVGALYGISKISENGNIWESVGVLTALAAILTIMFVVVKKVNDKGWALDATAIASLVAIPIALSLFIGALKKLDNIDGTTIGKLALLSIVVAGLFALISLINTYLVAVDLSGIAGLIAIPVSLLLFASALKSVAKVKWKEYSDSIGNGILMFLGVVYAISKMAKTAVNWKAIASIVAIPTALLLFAAAFKALGKVDWSDAENTLKSLVISLGIILSVMVMTRLAGEYAARGGAAAALIGIALIGIAKAFDIMMNMQFTKTKFEQVKEAIINVLEMFALITAATMLTGENAVKAGAAIILMSGALMAIAAAMVIMSLIDKDKITPVTDAVATILFMFAVITAASRNVTSAVTTILAITFCLGLLVAAIAVLSGIEDMDALMKATGCVAVLMAVFAGILAASKLASSADVLTILSFTFVVASLVAALYILKDIPGDQLIQSAEAMAIAMATVAGALAILALIPGGGIAILFAAIELAASITLLGVAAAAAGAGMAVLAWGVNLVSPAIVNLATSVVSAVLVVANGIVSLIKIIGEGAEAIGTYLIAGLVKGLVSGVQAIIEGAVSIGTLLINTVKQVLGINSPSTVFAGIGLNTILGLTNGVTGGLPLVANSGSNIASTLTGAVENGLNNSSIDLNSFLSGFGGDFSTLFGGTMVGSAQQGITDFNSYLLSGMPEDLADPEFMATYGKQYGEIFGESVTEGAEESMSNLSEILSQFTSMSDIDYSNIDGLSVSFDGLNASIANLNQEGVASLTESLTNLVTVTDENLTLVLNKMNETLPQVQTCGELFINSFTDGVKSKQSELYIISVFIIDGLISSIDGMLSRVFDAGARVGNTLLSGARSALDVNSPSKEFALIGNYSIMGLLGSVMSRLSQVRSAGYAVGDALLESTEDALSGYGGLLNSYTLGTVGYGSIQNGINGFTVGAQIDAATIDQLNAASQNGIGVSQIMQPTFNIYQQPGQDPEVLARIINRELGRMYVG